MAPPAIPSFPLLSFAACRADLSIVDVSDEREYVREQYLAVCERTYGYSLGEVGSRASSMSGGSEADLGTVNVSDGRKQVRE